MKRKIDVFEYAKDITTAISKGILITTKANKINAMTIGWGSLGIEWGLPIFTAYVRTGRFTAEQLQKNPEFTINIPVGDFNKKILGVCCCCSTGCDGSLCGYGTLGNPTTFPPA